LEIDDDEIPEVLEKVGYKGEKVFPHL